MLQLLNKYFAWSTYRSSALSILHMFFSLHRYFSGWSVCFVFELFEFESSLFTTQLFDFLAHLWQICNETQNRILYLVIRNYCNTLNSKVASVVIIRSSTHLSISNIIHSLLLWSTIMRKKNKNNCLFNIVL